MLPEITTMTHIKDYYHYFLGSFRVPPLSSLGNSLPLAATHSLPAVTGTLWIGMVPSSFWQAIIRGEKNKVLGQRGQGLGQIFKLNSTCLAVVQKLGESPRLVKREIRLDTQSNKARAWVIFPEPSATQPQSQKKTLLG